jgi:hypothetical protein
VLERTLGATEQSAAVARCSCPKCEPRGS